jgi:peptide chain release factor subunit 1
MPIIPTTTRLAPDQQQLRALLRRLAGVDSAVAPVLSVYLDLRPEAQGDRPGERNQLTVLRHRLRDVADTYEAHSQARRSVDTDVERIGAYLDGQLAKVEGVALFACDHIGLWEDVTTLVPFETKVTAGPVADLFQLANLLEMSESVVVAMVDTNTCRLFVTRRGALEELPGPDEPTTDHRRHDQGGWSQARYQRHIDWHDRRFVAEAAETLQALVERARARHVILAGEERAMTILQEVLPASIATLVEHVERIEMRASAREVSDEVAPLLAAIRTAEEQDAADRVIAGLRSGGMAVAGIDDVADALERGQVHELVLDEEAQTDLDLRTELVRQAAATDAQIVTVSGHTGLRARDGVGATLRWQT